MKKYLVVIEKTATEYSAYSPDLLGCVATGKTRSMVERRMKEAVRFHLDGLKAEGYNIPRPNAYSTYFEIAA
jgi:predicted RNase H-like HicB family nuclease